MPLQPSEWRASWQGRLLLAAKGQTGAVLLSILADSYDLDMPFLLRAVFPGFIEPALPCIISSARIGHTSCIFAQILDQDGQKSWQPLYRDRIELQDTFRRLADKVKLTDPERVELFAAINRWVVADFRKDPNFDPMDPDAIRLMH